ncbi:unnamed protein product [Cyprideis torosa]|uniref:MAU2 chromatid cohesion factor homolog n=1 Tax=Cyprideis torosa TaxID=163714 RepID=A0A7R8ZJB5_9CRUS|nr:unnamed protein product [Cyprideis torosa]CAG0879449.1 unnamed protein product [Cyprideis torosa]
MASSQDAWYLALLGVAEWFRTTSPPQIKRCIQYLLAIFKFSPPPKVAARTHLQLGIILMRHTKNIDMAKYHLESAWTMSQNLPSFEAKFEAGSVLAALYEQLNQVHLAKPVLRTAIEISQSHAYWHCRLLFQLAQIHMREGEFPSALGLLGIGADYAGLSGAHYTRILFILSKVMILMIERKFTEVQPLFTEASTSLEAYTGSSQKKDYLKVHLLVLQVWHHLLMGQAKTVKPWLKQLQSMMQTMSTDEQRKKELMVLFVCVTTTKVYISVFNFLAEEPGGQDPESFIWLPREHLCVLVYIVTVAHSMQSGYMDKGLKYAEKALVQVENMRSLDNRPVLVSFHLMLLEHLVQCRLVMGHKAQAIQEIHHVGQLATAHGMHRFLPQVHALVGLYAMSMNCMDLAEMQFELARRGETFSAQGKELSTFARLNLAIVYIRTKRDHDYHRIMEELNPEHMPDYQHCQKAAAYYVQGLYAFFTGQYHEAKRSLRESLKMGNTEELNRLTSCCLVLLGHIFACLGNTREAMNMVNPANALASKTPDVHIQLWAASILKDLHRYIGDTVREMEANQMYQTYSHMLVSDHITASRLPQHSMIQWQGGQVLPLTESPSTSQERLY